MATATLSGDLVSDATRTLGVEGDGRASPDSSVGVYPAATNRQLNPNAATNTTGWGGANGTLSRVTTGWTKFNGTAYRLVSGVTGTYHALTSPAFTPAGMVTLPTTAWAYSWWVSAAGGAIGQSLRLLVVFHGGAVADEFYFTDLTLTAGEARYHLLIPGLRQADRTTISTYVQVLGGGPGDEIRFGGGMLTAGDSVPVPYALAARTAGRVQLPMAGVTSRQGWVALRVRLNWGTGVPLDPVYLWRWGDMSLRWEDGRWRLTRGEAEATVIGVVTDGNEATIIGRWSDAGVSISAKGKAFRAADTLVVSDTFTRANQAGWGTPTVGDPWLINGLGTPQAAIVANRAVVTQPKTIYGYQILDLPPSRMAASVVFQPGANMGGVGLLAASSETSNIEEMTHFIPGFAGWAFQVTESDAFNLVTLLSGSYRTTLLNDGVTPYAFEMIVDGDTAYVTLPDGVKRSVSDPRIAAVHGRWISYELHSPGLTYVTQEFDSVEAEIPTGPVNAIGAAISEIDDALCDIGSAGDGTGHLDGDIRWVMAGAGRLTDTDATRIAAVVGDGGRSATRTSNALALSWSADDATARTYRRGGYAFGERTGFAYGQIGGRAA